MKPLIHMRRFEALPYFATQVLCGAWELILFHTDNPKEVTCGRCLEIMLMQEAKEEK